MNRLSLFFVSSAQRCRVSSFCLWLMLLAIGLSATLQAQSLTSLTCVPASGSSLSLNVYGLDLNPLPTGSLSSGGGGGLSLYVDFSDLSSLNAAVQAQTLYSTCTFYTATTPVVLNNVTFGGTLAFGSSGGEVFSIFASYLGFYSTKPLLYGSAGLTFQSSSIPSWPLSSSLPAVAILTCGSTVRLPVYTYSLDGPGVDDLTLGTDLGAINPIQAAQDAGTVIPACTLSTGTATASLTNVSVNSVGILGYGAGILEPKPAFYVSVVATAGLGTLTGSPVYAKPVGTLACSSALSLPLYSFDMDDDGDGAGDVTSGVAEYATLAAADSAGTVYPSCTLTAGSTTATLTNVVFSESGLVGDGGLNAMYNSVYAHALISFDSFSSGGITIPFPSSTARPTSAKHAGQSRAGHRLSPL